MKELWIGLALVVATAVSTWAITYTFIVPQTTTDNRIEQAARSYSDFGNAFVRLVGVQSAIKAAQASLVGMHLQATQYDVKTADWTEDQIRSPRAESITAEIDYFAARVRIAVYGDSETIKLVKDIKGKMDAEN